MGNHKVLKPGTRNTGIRYSMYDFIECIKKQTVLWNRSNPNFHNREKREQAWHDVGEDLYKDFYDCADSERQQIALQLAKRWKNTRDSFFRAQRLKQSNNEDEKNRSYIYEKEMSFMIQEPHDDKDDVNKALTTKNKNNNNKRKHNDDVAEHNNDDSDDSGAENLMVPVKVAAKVKNQNAAKIRRRTCASSSTVNVDSNKRYKIQQTSAKPQLRKQRTPTVSSECSLVSIMGETECYEIPTKEEQHLDESVTSMYEERRRDTEVECAAEAPAAVSVAVPAAVSTAVVFDADQAFFDSIKPVVSKMSVDQKLDFQIEILKLLKSYRSTCG